MEQLLVNLPVLKHFEVSAQGFLDLTDGQAWEKITHQLLTFNFHFSVEIDWIDEKKWFVACTRKRLFSVPHFSPTYADVSFRPSLYSTIPNSTIELARINHFILNDSKNILHVYLRHIKSLEIQNSLSIENLSIFIDLNQVEHLIISSSINHSTMFSLMQLMSTLRHLSLNISLKDFILQIENQCFKQVETLEINQPIMNNDFFVVEKLVLIFPNVKILHINSVSWGIYVAYLLDKFENLSSASFQLNQQGNVTEINVTNFIKYQTQSLRDSASFTCRCRIGQNELVHFDFWIQKQVSLVRLYLSA